MLWLQHTAFSYHNTEPLQPRIVVLLRTYHVSCIPATKYEVQAFLTHNSVRIALAGREPCLQGCEDYVGPLSLMAVADTTLDLLCSAALGAIIARWQRYDDTFQVDWSV
jgi:hypothetical protein